MTITEATAVNVTLNKLLDDLDGLPVPEDVVDAMALLADKAFRALYAGLTGDEVRRRLEVGS